MDGRRTKAMCKCRCIISFAIDSVGAADNACVGDGVVGEASRATGSSVGKRKSDGETNKRCVAEDHVVNVREESAAIEDVPNNLLETPGAGRRSSR
jgi:hypothetical protein